MAGATLTVKAVEGSTYVVTIKFFDENGQPVVPNTAEWTLTDEDGNIVNSRDGVEIGSPDSTIEVLLGGSDLPGPGNVLFAVDATYDSALGTDLPLVDQIRIRVDGIVP